MQYRLDSPDWHNAVAGIISSADDQSVAGALISAIGTIVDHEGTCLMAFHKDSGPEVLHHTLEPEGERHYLDRYLAGPYLLDPLYQLALRKDKPTLCRFRDQLPDRFRSSEYYRQYCDQTHLLDEMDFLGEVSEGTTVVLVIGRRKRMFSKSELMRLERIEPVVQAAMRKIWSGWVWTRRASDRNDAMHRRLTRCFENFGWGVLTGREREISQLLLRGHSTKSIARILDIAPGTVMVHKRNLFSKLGITSQYELFSIFIDDLGRS
ncbi:MAG: LuxR C-terminal-related transcriptional regulator [Woeseia sp.]